MIKKIASYTLLGFIIIFGLGACTAVGKMPIEIDNRVKEMSPTPDKALVYVVRPSGSGRNVTMPVTCDEYYLGTTGGDRYLAALIEPGAHHFSSKAENTSELDIVLEAGKIYYLEQKIKMGLFKARANLERLSDEEGLKKLKKCELSVDLGDFAKESLGL